MAVVTATITVDFTSQYAGAHRVCWRIQGSGDPYDCSTVVNCTGGGTACQAIFTADVNTTSCDGTVTFEGYVQAGCEDVASTVGRIPFTVDFVPTPTCLRHTMLCAYGEILSVDSLTGGHSYDVTDTVVITRQPGDTQALDADVEINNVGDGVIVSVDTLSSGGTGYIVNDILDIVDGVGAGAGAQIQVDSVGGGGDILTWTLIAPGTDYVGGLFLSGGTGSGATLGTVTYKVFGEISDFTINDPGEYSIPPVVTITTGTGVGFTGEVTLEDCGTHATVYRDCGGTDVDITIGLPVGDSIEICYDNLYFTPDRYTFTESGCCIPEDSESDVCTAYSIDNQTGGPISFPYTECGGNFATVAIANGAEAVVCAVDGGVTDAGISGLTITESEVPCPV